MSKDGGRPTYQGLAKVMPGAINAKINLVCDASIFTQPRKRSQLSRSKKTG
jgi:Fe-S cluster assembly protein SufB